MPWPSVLDSLVNVAQPGVDFLYSQKRAKLGSHGFTPDLRAHVRRAPGRCFRPLWRPWDMWAAINQLFWDDQLSPGPIHWGLTAGCSFGWFLGHGHSGQITLHEALTGTAFDDWVMADRSQARSSWNMPLSAFGIGTALGTLLHESMHQAHHQRGQEYGLDRLGNREPHHCQTWGDECARIAPMVGQPTLTWPVYIERKESTEKVFNRIERQHAAGNPFNPYNFSRNELSNRRQWIQIPTINGEQIDPADWDGPPLATTGEMTMFPRATYERMGLPPANRVGLILAAADPLPAPEVITPADGPTPASPAAGSVRRKIRSWIKANPGHTNLPAAQQWAGKDRSQPPRPAPPPGPAGIVWHTQRHLLNRSRSCCPPWGWGRSSPVSNGQKEEEVSALIRSLPQNRSWPGCPAESLQHGWLPIRLRQGPGGQTTGR